MLYRVLTPLLAAAACVAIGATTPSTPHVQVQPMAKATVVPTRPPALHPMTFGVGGAVSPAGCHIINVQNPHISTFMQQRKSVRAVKGNAVAGCNSVVPYLSLSVSVIDVGEGAVVARQNRPKEIFNDSHIESLETIVPCINNNATTYQVTALGVSQEGERFYTQTEFGKMLEVNCGH